jgi:hypothetical protein
MVKWWWNVPSIEGSIFQNTKKKKPWSIVVVVLYSLVYILFFESHKSPILNPKLGFNLTQPNNDLDSKSRYKP